MLYQDILSNWSLTFARQRPDLAVPGSPERCLFRHVVEDEGGGLWLLEQLSPGQAARRKAMGQVLDGLSGRGLPGLAPYRRANSGSFVCKGWGRSWQLSPFIRGVPLIQPDYLEDAAKGAALGEWMSALRRAADGLPVPDGLFELDLPAYVAKLLERIRRSGEAGDFSPSPAENGPAGSQEQSRQSLLRPGLDLSVVHERARGVLPALAPLFEAWPHLPRALCHGDLHPLNVVWGGVPSPGLLAVIDWEFAGVRPALYDLANCLGCLLIEGGFQDTPFASALLDSVRSAGLVPREQTAFLPAMVLATRFGWLSEWLRRRDGEMLAHELDFMAHLSRVQILIR